MRDKLLIIVILQLTLFHIILKQAFFYSWYYNLYSLEAAFTITEN